jgi:hypothetical protein
VWLWQDPAKPIHDKSAFLQSPPSARAFLSPLQQTTSTRRLHPRSSVARQRSDTSRSAQKNTGQERSQDHSRPVTQTPARPRYLTVNVAVAVFVKAPETPVNVMVYVPAFVLAGNRIPDRAKAV